VSGGQAGDEDLSTGAAVVPLPTRPLLSPGIVHIAADDAEFSDTDVVAAGRLLAPHVNVDVAKLFQFSALEEIARVIVEVGPGAVTALTPELAGSALYDAIRHLLTRRRGGGQTMVDLRFSEDASSRHLQAVVVTDDPDVATSAVQKCFEQLDRLNGVVDFDVDAGVWRSHEE
jgi:hypothetical protein